MGLHERKESKIKRAGVNFIMNKKEWIQSIKIGDIVCDCRYYHSKIVEFTISGSGDKNLTFEDGYSCSARHCCGPIDHEPHWYVYILKCKDNSLYTGITNNLEKRIEKHNKGIGAKYTKGRRPVKLMKKFTVNNKSEALKLECKIKKLSKKEKLEFKID